MVTKPAAHLRRGDGVILSPGDRRVVEAILPNGATGVRIHWFGHIGWTVVAADQPMTIEEL